jgi:hypothetical protein
MSQIGAGILMHGLTISAALQQCFLAQKHRRQMLNHYEHGSLGMPPCLREYAERCE